MHETQQNARIVNRFRSFLPVVVDVETGGLNPETDALLEIAAIVIDINDEGKLVPGELFSSHVTPFPGANIEPESLAVTGIDPDHPLRDALEEKEALRSVFIPIRRALRATQCTRAVLVGHNPAFDLSFVHAAANRNSVKRNPFHAFSTFDTATLAGLAYGQTILARAVEAAGLNWDETRAHSAVYDATITAQLFCGIVNRWDSMTGNAALTESVAS
ncbi:MAG: ribonuclease T [Gammaproteobacteria bacterium]|nr:MAG: ribonuclease T [Gammaproteobacteria bacterium]